MSPEQPHSEMEQLDLLAVELADAGKIARESTAQRGRPDGIFTMRLREELLSSFGSIGMVRLEDADAPSLVAPMPVPAADVLAFEARDQAEAPQPVEAGSEVESPEPMLGQIARVLRTPRTTEHRPVPVMASAPDTELADATTSDVVAPEPAGPTRLRARVRPLLRPSARPSRFVGLGLAACLALIASLLGIGLLSPVKAPARVDDALAASLVHGDSSTPLAAGALLTQGDEIRVAEGGYAYLSLASSYVRLAAGADLKLDSLDTRDIKVSQLAGRVYHRVVLPDGGSYRVMTGNVAWAATGTAFDLDRTTSASSDTVLGMALQHDLQVSGYGVDAAVPQGTSALITLSSSGLAVGAPATSDLGEASLENPWLLTNAGLDAQLGLPLGELADALHPTPTPTPTASATEVAAPTTEPTAVPAETAAEPTTAPTAAPTKAPTPKPTPKPTAAGIPNLGTLSIADAGGGNYSFSWPKYGGSGFEYYKLMYAPWGTNPTYGGSGANYWACPSDPADTSWSGLIEPGSWGVRVQVVDTSSGKTVIRAQTPVIHLNVPLPATVSLGALTVQDNGDGTYTFKWTKFTGPWFSYYKLVYGPSGSSPSYPGGSSYWAAISNQSQTQVTLKVGTGGFEAGTYAVRLQAIDYPGGHAYAYAETDIADPVTTAPAPTPAPTAAPT